MTHDAPGNWDRDELTYLFCVYQIEGKYVDKPNGESLRPLSYNARRARRQMPQPVPADWRLLLDRIPGPSLHRAPV